MQDDLLDKRAVCALIGGSKPIHSSTLWRGIRQGRYPKPIRVSVQSRRWVRAEVEAVLQALAEGRV